MTKATSVMTEPDQADDPRAWLNQVVLKTNDTISRVGGTNGACRAAAPSVFVKLEICDTLRKIYPTSFLELLPALKSFNEGVFCKLL